MFRIRAVLPAFPLTVFALTLWAVPQLFARTGQAGAAERKTVWDGVYIDSQAAAGQAIYEQHCSSCHGATLVGGSNQAAPALKGDKFMENWREDQLQSLYHKTRTTMPRRSDKVLTEVETLDVISYILRENGFPVGPNALDVGVLGAIQIERQTGPAPLPNNSLIHAVGCLAQDGNAWTLKAASPPLRVRSSEETTPEELQAAEMKPLGTMTLRLQNLIMLGSFKPDHHAGHKMLAKGALVRRSDGDNISLTELEMLSPSCGQ